MSKYLLVGLIVGIAHTGNIHWEDYPFCSGNTQSPRSIHTDTMLDGSDVCVPHINWIIKHWESWKIVNTGHTIKLTPYNTTENIALLPNQFNPIYDVNGEYCFDSFHFHWGSNEDLGSEHTFDDKRFELEIHFVHYSCDYENISMALSPSLNNIEIPDPYTLGVVGVMADNTDEDNHSFDLILNELHNIRYPANTVEGVSGEAIIHGFDIADILPLNRNEFYYYEGSLTTPPCNPIVRWHVLKNNINISNKQLGILRIAMADTITPEYNNYREIQNNINPVYECLLLHGHNSDTHGNTNCNDHSTTISMVIVGFIAMVAIVAVVVEVKVSAKRDSSNENNLKGDMTKRVQSKSHLSRNGSTFSTNSTHKSSSNLYHATAPDIVV